MTKQNKTKQKVTCKPTLRQKCKWILQPRKRFHENQFFHSNYSLDVFKMAQSLPPKEFRWNRYDFPITRISHEAGWFKVGLVRFLLEISIFLKWSNRRDVDFLFFLWCLHNNLPSFAKCPCWMHLYSFLEIWDFTERLTMQESESPELSLGPHHCPLFFWSSR